jgi:hypothetical protein
VCDGGTCLARLRSRGEGAGGVGARRGLCEGMRERAGVAVTDGGLRVLGRGSFGVLCCGVGADTKEPGTTTCSTDEASSPGPTGGGECGVGVVAGVLQEQAKQGAAECEAVWVLCGCDREEGGRAREHGLTCG